VMLSTLRVLVKPKVRRIRCGGVGAVFRPAGALRYVMRGPDGKEYPSEGVYVEIEPPKRLVWKALIHDVKELEVWTEVMFAEHEGKTKVTVNQKYSFESDATRGAPIGWSQTLDRLTNYLATL
jgi:uncharacterized protein YndB with AHSA1/START domain